MSPRTLIDTHLPPVPSTGGSVYDHFAHNYDAAFTRSGTGQKQRLMVHDFLKGQLHRFHSVLELACGTGEDALWLAKQGKKVLATDISAKMLGTAREKAAAFPGLSLEWQQLDAAALQPAAVQDRYDWVFSDFGGLNCLSPDALRHLLRTLREHVVAPGGRVALVLMSKGSIWETAFALRRLELGKAFRRRTSGPLAVRVGETQIPTWYYNPSFFRSLRDSFDIEHVQTVGFFLPPSYLEAYFAKRPALLERLFSLEKRCCRLRFLAAYSDHYLIVLRPR